MDDLRVTKEENAVEIMKQVQSAVSPLANIVHELTTKVVVANETHNKDQEYVAKMLVEIKEQTTKHNGRMSKMEAWRNIMVGGLAVLTVILIPILTWALSQIVKIPEMVQNGTKTAIDDYNLSITK